MAITEYYVRDDAAGGGDGTTDANSGANGAFTWAEVVTRMSAGAAAAGDRYNIKKAQGAGYTGLSTATFTNDGTAASPIIFRGFNSTIGDLATVGRANGTGALTTTDFPVLSFASAARLNASGSDYIVFQNLKVTVASTGFSGAVLNIGPNSIAYRCYADNISTNAAAAAIGTGSASVAIIDCDAALTGASGGDAAIKTTGGSSRIIGCRVIQSTNHGIAASGTVGHLLVLGNVVANCAGDGIAYTGTTTSTILAVIGNTVDDCTGQGISIGNAAFTGLQLFLNNHVTDCARGFYSNYDGTAQVAGVFGFNRTRDNTTAAIDGFDDWASATTWSHVTTDTDDAGDFTNAGSNDYTLISSAAAKGAGLPSYADIGGLQRQEPASSGGGGAIVIGG